MTSPTQLKFVFRESYPSYSLEVEFRGDEIGSIMNQYLEAMPKLHETIKKHIPFLQAVQIRQRRQLTCKELLLRLNEEFWFDKPRNLPATQLKLQQLGYNYEGSSIAHALHELFQEGILKRDGVRRNFHYLRKGIEYEKEVKP